MEAHPLSSEVSDRLEAVLGRIDAAAERSGRSRQDITLVGVCKRQPLTRVVEAVRAGLRHLGESYVQEALKRRAEVRAELEAMVDSPLSWHFVGHLQRNKARLAAEAFDCIQSLDSVALGRELERRAAACGRRLQVLVQVNLSGEPQKAGVAPEAVEQILAASAEWQQLELTGLMAIPAAGEPEQARAAFARLRELRDELRHSPGGAGLRELSMGMSGDFEVAIEEGATIVRVGTAVFGPRGE